MTTYYKILFGINSALIYIYIYIYIYKQFDSESVCNKNFLKTEIKSYETTDFFNREILKVDSNYTGLQ